MIHCDNWVIKYDCRQIKYDHQRLSEIYNKWRCLLSTVYIAQEELDRQRGFSNSVRRLLVSETKFYIYTYGCQLNDNDTEKLKALLLEMGFSETEDPTVADLILMNTCSVRGNADQRFFGNLGIVKTIKEKNPKLIVGVCGCMMKVDEHVEKIRRSYSFVDIIFGTSDIHRLPELLYRRLSGVRRVYDISDDDVIAEGVPMARERRYRALCTIMYGCNNFCSYCIVPYTRGRERSRKKEQVLAEIRDLVADDFSEVLLLGQNVNAYGKDLPAKGGESYSFANLLEDVAKTGMRRIRFMTSHPKDITLELLDVMAAYDNIEQHLHLPLQSGSDRILKEMNRHYTAEHYLDIIKEARLRMPDLAFSTDIIVGFPGETEEDFQATLDVVAAVGFDSAYTFQYSPRVGTPAALEINKVPKEVVTERFNRLLELQNQNALSANQRRVGTRPEVLIEGLADHHEGQLTGRSSDNCLINFTVSNEIFDQLNIERDNYSILGNKLKVHFVKSRLRKHECFRSTANF